MNKKNIRHLTVIITAILALFNVSCSKYDSDIENLDKRVASLEAQVNQINSDIAAIQTIITALQNGATINSVSTAKDGYVIVFSDSNTAYTKSAVEGTFDDQTTVPAIGVAQENGEGIFYWTVIVNDETSWLFDDDGNKLKVAKSDGSDANDGVTPVLSIDKKGYWCVSYGGSSLLKRLSDANGNAILSSNGSGSTFSSIDVSDSGYVTFTLSDGTTFTVLRTIRFKIGTDIENTSIPVFETKTVSLSLPSDFKAGDYEAIGAEIAINMSTESAYLFDWTVEVIKPTFSNGKYNGDAAIKVSYSGSNSDKVVVKATIVWADGTEAVAYRTFCSNNSIFLSFADDDALDTFLNPLSSWDGGFFSRLYPMLESVGAYASEAVECWRIGGMNDYVADDVRPSFYVGPNTDKIAKVLKELIHQKGWEAANHTMNARYLGEYKAASIDQVVNSGLSIGAGRYYKSTGLTCIYNTTDKKHYYCKTKKNVGTSKNPKYEYTWAELPAEFRLPFLYTLSNGKWKMNEYNPDFLWDWYIGEAKTSIERILDTKIRVYMAPGSSVCDKADNTAFATGHDYSVHTTDNVKNASIVGVNIKPDGGIINRMNINIGSGSNVGTDAISENILAKVDQLIECGSRHIVLYSHAYEEAWSNERPATPVMVSQEEAKRFSLTYASSVDYPSSWIVPVRDPDAYPFTYLLPHPKTNISNWKQWHPCPGTNMYQVWKVLKILIEERGLIPTTYSGGQDAIQ